MRWSLPFLTAFLMLGCSTARVTLPVRSATEQLLVSEATDVAATAIELRLPRGVQAYLDTTNFDGVDARYAISAIRENLLRQGIALMDKREDAGVVIEVRAGALSIDSINMIVGTPTLHVNTLFLPGVSLSQSRMTGVAKFSLFAFDRKTGLLVAIAAPVTGLSQRKTKASVSIISWTSMPTGMGPQR